MCVCVCVFECVYAGFVLLRLSGADSGAVGQDGGPLGRAGVLGRGGVRGVRGVTGVNPAVGRVEDWGRRGGASEGEERWVILVCWGWGEEGEVGGGGGRGRRWRRRVGGRRRK